MVPTVSVDGILFRAVGVGLGAALDCAYFYDKQEASAIKDRGVVVVN